MKKILVIVGIAITGAVVVWSFALMSETSYYKIEKIGLIGQAKREWCWVASTKMVANFISGNNPVLSQSEIYRKNEKLGWDGEMSNSDCDTSNTSNNNPLGDTEFYRRFFRSYKRNITLESISNRRKDEVWANLKKELLNDSPVIFNGVECRDCPDKKGFWTSHVFVCVGFFEDGERRFLIVNDPWKPCEGCNYYLSLESVFDNTEGVNLESSTMVYGFNKGFFIRSFINWLKSKFDKPRNSIPEPNAVQLPETFLYKTIKIEKNGKLDSYLVQKIRKSDLKVVDAYIYRQTTDPVMGNQIWLDSFQMHCFIKPAITDDLTNMVLYLRNNDHDSEMVFDFSGRHYEVPLHTFNEMLETPGLISDPDFILSYVQIE